MAQSSFLLFINPDACRLTSIKLSSVLGILNEDFSTFISAAAPTLEHLSVGLCDISKPKEGEEHAIDAAMSQMKRLRVADVQGNIVSPLSLLRKGPCDSHQTGSNCCQICIRSELSFLSGSDVSARRLLHGERFENLVGTYVSVLEETGWSGVHLFVSHHLEFDDNWHPAYDVAERRGIKFGVYGPYQ
jgi:hypothetical protein